MFLFLLFRRLTRTTAQLNAAAKPDWSVVSVFSKMSTDIAFQEKVIDKLDWLKVPGLYCLWLCKLDLGGAYSKVGAYVRIYGMQFSGRKIAMGSNSNISLISYHKNMN